LIGLRGHERDPSLPARAGEPGLVAPAPEELLELVSARLLRPGAPKPHTAELTYARWKPGTSITAGYAVEFADGERRTVSLKRYAGSKADALFRRVQAEPRADTTDDRLKPRAVLPQRGLHLWAFPHDRALPGLERLLDLLRTARMLAELGLFAPLEMRPGPSQVEVLRYKPERRAVLGLRLALRPPGHGPRTWKRLAARALVPGQAARLAVERRALEGHPVLPELLAVQPRTGLVLEEWLDVRTQDPDTFDHAPQAGVALAALHRSARPARSASRRDPAALRALFELDPELTAASAGLEEPSARDTCWIHGDFHPDQVAFERDGGATRLLDLDGLGAGDPARDLATWIADHLALDEAVDFERASGPLLAGYRAGGGEAPEPAHLGDCVVWALVQLAAGRVRRLERGAVERALALLRRARSIAPQRGAAR